MTRPVSWRGWVALLVVGVVITAVAGCGNLMHINQTKPGAKVDPVSIPRANQVRVHGLVLAVIAQFATEGERERGLMGRGATAGHAGVFVWGTSTTDSFWMKNTPTDLAVMWVSAGRVVGTANMYVCKISCPSYNAPGPYDTAVEAPVHTFDHVRAGEPVVFV